MIINVMRNISSCDVIDLAQTKPPRCLSGCKKLTIKGINVLNILCHCTKSSAPVLVSMSARAVD